MGYHGKNLMRKIARHEIPAVNVPQMIAERKKLSVAQRAAATSEPAAPEATVQTPAAENAAPSPSAQP